MASSKIQTIVQVPSPVPFDYVETMRFQTNYRKQSGSDYFENGVYMKAMRIKGQPVILEVKESADHESVEARVISPNLPIEQSVVRSAVSLLLGFDLALTEFHDFVEQDEVLSSLIGRFKGLRLTRTGTVYEAMINAIIGQQISSMVAGVIREAFLKHYGLPLKVGQTTLYVFPEPEDVYRQGIETLKTLKLSGKKAEYIYEISQRSAQGELDYEELNPLSNDEIIQRFVAIRGIGIWTAEWVLLRSLGRMDAIPAGDLALQRMVAEFYFGKERITEKEVREFAKKHWSPFEGLVTLYLFALLRESREKLLEGTN